MTAAAVANCWNTGRLKHATSLLLLFIWRSSGGAGNRAVETQKKPCPVGQHEISADRLIRSFLGLIGVDGEFCSNLYGIFGHAQADQCVRAAAFDHPFDDLSIRAFHVDMEPRVRIDHFPLRESS